MLINLRNALMSGKRLPYDAEVEYLSSSANAGMSGIPPVYVNTGVALSANVKMSVTAAFNSTAYQLMGYYGGSSGRFDIGINSSGKFVTSIGETTTRATADTNIHEFVLDAPNATAYIDGVGVSTGAFSVSISGNIILFSRGRGDYTPPLDFNQPYSKVDIEIYSCKIWDNGVLVRDFIPVRKGTVGYLYDRVSGKLFGNAGTGDFVLGPDVVPVEYIESTGTQWIDTGFVPSGQTKWELDAIFPIGSGFSPMGAMSTSPDSRFLIGREQNPSYFNMSCGPNNAMRIAVDGSRNLFELDAQNNTWRIGDTSGTFPTGTFDTSAIRSVYLFARNKNGSAEYLNNGSRVFKSKLYNSNTIIQNSIPVRVGSGSTWEGAMMDVLTRRIYRNAGTGAFTYGNDLKYPIPAA